MTLRENWFVVHLANIHLGRKSKFKLINRQRFIIEHIICTLRIYPTILNNFSELYILDKQLITVGYFPVNNLSGRTYIEQKRLKK